MAKFNDDDIVIIHEFSDGRIMTNEEFMSKPFKVDLTKEGNKTFIRNFEVAFSKEISIARKRNEKVYESIKERQLKFQEELKDLKIL